MKSKQTPVQLAGWENYIKHSIQMPNINMMLYQLVCVIPLPKEIEGAKTSNPQIFASQRMQASIRQYQPTFQQPFA